MSKDKKELKKPSSKKPILDSDNEKALSKSTKTLNKAAPKRKPKSDVNEDWYDYVDINLLLKEMSNNDQDYKVMEATSQDDLQLLQRVSKAFFKLNALNKPVVISINLGDKRLDDQYEGSHWVALAIKKENGTLKAFFNDSLGIPMSNYLPNLQKILENHKVHKDNIYDLQNHQQNDGFNCGPYTILNLDSLARNGELQEITIEQITAQRKHLAEIKADYLGQEEQEALSVPDKQMNRSDKRVDTKKQDHRNSDILDANEDETPFMKQLDNYYSGIVTKLNNLNKDEFIDQVNKLKIALINILENLNDDRDAYPFIVTHLTQN